MRALTIDAHGGTEQIRFRDDLPEPQLRAPHEVRVRVRAVALNRLDLWTVGGLPGVTITPPWVLGADCTGVVESVGDAVEHLRVGQRIVVNPGLSCRDCEWCRRGEQPLCPRFGLLGEHHPGSFAEFVVLPAANVLPIADRVPDDVAAAHTLATLTAWRMCVSRAKVQAGEDVLIWGIGGGVAQAALRICKQLGARVWVTSSDAAKLERAAALGADVCLDHAREDVGRAVRERTGKRGVDVVIESVGENTWNASLMALSRGGRLVTCGGTSGAQLQMDVRRLFWYQWSLLGSTMGNDAEFAAVTAELNAGRLWPTVDAVYPLAEGRAAFERMARGEQFGKLVLRVSDG
ncbi:MAG: zinc-binding dehydrogenase [Gemmatimonadaceae bacterium]|nr:zinc-binding dehydrogenase [Gemmatimonadaceae bacterium]MCW5827187.1 zinc-binding dehydrogenase [Gemmatimonadaceae bacterium]